jgi:hypothetical protein
MGKRDEYRVRDLGSVMALKKLLNTIALEGHASGRSITPETLASQGRLASFSDHSLGIVSMSLNHLKAVADQINGGFKELDASRRAALAALTGETPTGIAQTGGEKRDPQDARDELSRLRSEVARMKEELRVTREDLALLQRAYDERCRQARLYAGKASKSVQLQCQQDQRALDQSLSLCRRLNTNDNVIPMEDRRA